MNKQNLEHILDMLWIVTQILGQIAFIWLAVLGAIVVIDLVRGVLIFN